MPDPRCVNEHREIKRFRQFEIRFQGWIVRRYSVELCSDFTHTAETPRSVLRPELFQAGARRFQNERGCDEASGTCGCPFMVGGIIDTAEKNSEERRCWKECCMPFRFGC